MKVESAQFFGIKRFEDDILSDVCRIMAMKSANRFTNIRNGLLYRDRFNYFNKFSPIDWSEKRDKLEFSNKTIEDCCLERSKELVNTGEKLNILYSGGVDSCALVSSFLENKDQIRIFLTEDSIRENPDFYELIKRNNLETHLRNGKELNKEIVKFDGIILNGHPADQLFGSMICLDFPNFIRMDYRDVLKKYVGEYIILNNDVDYVISMIDEYTKTIGLERIETYQELMHLLNFGIRYSFIKDHITFDLKEFDFSKESISFFDTQDFNNWTFSNWKEINDLKPMNTNEYKFHLKKFIENISGFKEIWKIPKRGSWSANLFTNDKSFWVKTEESYMKFSITDEFIKECRGKNVNNLFDFERKMFSINVRDKFYKKNFAKQNPK